MNDHYDIKVKILIKYPHLNAWYKKYEILVIIDTQMVKIQIDTSMTLFPSMSISYAMVIGKNPLQLKDLPTPPTPSLVPWYAYLYFLGYMWRCVEYNVPSFGLTSIRWLQSTLGELDPTLKLMTNVTPMLSISLNFLLLNIGIVDLQRGAWGFFIGIMIIWILQSIRFMTLETLN